MLTWIAANSQDFTPVMIQLWVQLHPRLSPELVMAYHNIVVLSCPPEDGSVIAAIHGNSQGKSSAEANCSQQRFEFNVDVAVQQEAF